MTTDYASQLLGDANSSPAPAQNTDYASQLLGGKEYAASSAVRPVESESEGASFGALTKASAVDNPQTKVRIFAKSRFPDLPENDAVNRYGIIGGEIVYLDKDGKIKKESPSGVGGFFKEFGASLVGNAPTVIGGALGAVAGAPAGPVGAAGGAAIGAAGGKAINQIIANLLFDEPQTPVGNIKGMAQEGAVNAATTWLGSALSQKIAERALTRDIAKLDRPAAEALARKGADIGVDLNVAQTTNMPSLKGRFEVLGRLEPSMDIIDASRVKQGEQAARAATGFIDDLSRTSSPRAAGEGARSGATTVLDKISENRAIASRPLYEKALSASVNMADEQLQSIAGTPAFKAAWERAQKIAANEGVDLGNAVNNMKALHYVKLGMDDLIQSGKLKEGIGPTEQRAIIGVKNRLLTWMDKAAPDYARARSVYGHYMPTLKMQREGLVGEIADLADTDLSAAARKVFDPRNAPEDIAKMRSQFFRYDEGEKWKSLTASYLRETFEKAGQEFKSGAGGVRNQASSWRAAMVGNPKQLANLKAAMTEPQFRGFSDMMEVFEAMGRVSGTGGSPTMPLQVAKEQLTREAAGPISKTVEFATSPLSSVRDWLAEARLGKHAEEMARVMTSPDGLATLKQIRRMSPNDQRAVAAFSSLFGIGKQSDQPSEDMPIGTKK